MSGSGEANTRLDRVINSKKLTNLEENSQFDYMGARWPKDGLLCSKVIFDE